MRRSCSTFSTPHKLLHYGITIQPTCISTNNNSIQLIEGNVMLIPIQHGALLKTDVQIIYNTYMCVLQMMCIYDYNWLYMCMHYACVCRFDFIELYINMINMRIWFGLIINKCIWVHFIWPVDVSQRNLADLAMGISTNKNCLDT